MGIFTNTMFSSRILRVFVSRCLWLLLSCILSFGSEEDISCLKSIKHSLQDPYNYLNDTWNFDNRMEGFICKFAGVECWHEDENRVLNLRLSDMGLKGEFPRGLQNCTSITGIDLSGNALYGPIPDDICFIIQYATSLDLSSNSFSGVIPANLANYTFLNVLKLDHNQLTGQIPAQLGSLGRIKTFSVANNLPYGQVPTFINAACKAESYANNSGLCGKPLGPCPIASTGIHTADIAGAAIGAAIGVGIGAYMESYWKVTGKLF